MRHSIKIANEIDKALGSRINTRTTSATDAKALDLARILNDPDKGDTSGANYFDEHGKRIPGTPDLRKNIGYDANGNIRPGYWLAKKFDELSSGLYRRSKGYFGSPSDTTHRAERAYLKAHKGEERKNALEAIDSGAYGTALGRGFARLFGESAYDSYVNAKRDEALAAYRAQYGFEPSKKAKEYIRNIKNNLKDAVDDPNYTPSKEDVEAVRKNNRETAALGQKIRGDVQAMNVYTNPNYVNFGVHDPSREFLRAFDRANAYVMNHPYTWGNKEGIPTLNQRDIMLGTNINDIPPELLRRYQDAITRANTYLRTSQRKNQDYIADLIRRRSSAFDGV